MRLSTEGPKEEKKRGGVALLETNENHGFCGRMMGEWMRRSGRLRRGMQKSVLKSGLKNKLKD